jgi:hypothetical protein
VHLQFQPDDDGRHLRELLLLLLLGCRHHQQIQALIPVAAAAAAAAALSHHLVHDHWQRAGCLQYPCRHLVGQLHRLDVVMVHRPHPSSPPQRPLLHLQQQRGGPALHLHLQQQQLLLRRQKWRAVHL